MYVYRNGVRIGRFDGEHRREGSRDADGCFHHPAAEGGSRILDLQRREDAAHAAAHVERHRHARGRLPGYPASHGCVRLSVDFAEKLYTVTSNGTTVIMTDRKNAPGQTGSPGLLLSGKTGDAPSAPLPAGGFDWEPEKSPKGAVSIIFSMPDSTAYVYRDGVQIGRTAFSPDPREHITGSHVYSALGNVDDDGRRDWLSTTSIGGSLAPNVSPAEFPGNARIIAPGIILTDMRLAPDAQRVGLGTERGTAR